MQDFFSAMVSARSLDYSLWSRLMGAMAVQHDGLNIVLQHFRQRFRRKSADSSCHGAPTGRRVISASEKVTRSWKREHSADHVNGHVRSPSLCAGRDVVGFRNDGRLRREQVAVVALVTAHLKQQDEQ